MFIIKRESILLLVLAAFFTSCSNIAFSDKIFIKKIDKSYSFSTFKDSSLSKFRSNFGNDFVYKEFDSNIKRIYVGHILFKGKDVYFPKPPLYFEFNNDNLKEFGVVRPAFMSIKLISLVQDKIIVKKEKAFPISKKK